MHKWMALNTQSIQLDFSTRDSSTTAVPETKSQCKIKQEVKVIWQKVPHGEPIPRLGVTPGGRNLYHWIPGVGVPISVP